MAELAKATPKELRVDKLRADLRDAKARCEQLMDEHAELEAASRRLRRALDVVDTEAGCLRTTAHMQAEVETVAAQLIASRRREARKAGKYLKQRSEDLTRFAEAVHTELEPMMAACGSEPVILAAVMCRLHDKATRCRDRARREAHRRHLAAAYVRIRQAGLGAQAAADLLDEVAAVLVRSHRASSAIESVNAALRTHLTIRKRTTNNFLQLFMAYSNLRTRRWGRFKGTSAWGLLSGRPPGDWLTHLGYPASL